jgi:uncharacterized protein YjbI with pentapeptide repeats
VHWGHLPLAGDTFAQSSMLGSVFLHCRMRPMKFDEVDFTLAVLGGNDLRGVDLGGCGRPALVETDLRKAVLRGADLPGARTTGARLDDAVRPGDQWVRHAQVGTHVAADDHVATRREITL